MDAILPTRARPGRRLRLTLGAMMLMVLAVGGAMGWIAYRARLQREAVAAILAARGRVSCGWQMRSGIPVKDGAPRGPAWLRGLMGPDVFDAVAFVGLRGRTLDDGVMAQLGKLDRFEL